MSTYRLDQLFAPESIALVGASPRPTSPGRAVLRNLRAGGFRGAVHLVNPHYDEVEGIRSVKSFNDLPAAPDLVVIAVPAPAVPSLVAAAGERGTAAAIIITAGLGHGPGSLAEACEQAARTKGLRLVGPNCLPPSHDMSCARGDTIECADEWRRSDHLTSFYFDLRPPGPC
jgi:acetyltransferase